jgi:hypothetical protein
MRHVSITRMNFITYRIGNLHGEALIKDARKMGELLTKFANESGILPGQEGYEARMHIESIAKAPITQNPDLTD